MTFSRNKKVGLALLLLVLLGIFLPPNINGNRFGKRLAEALSTSMGRRVTIGSVNFRLLPRPGFDLYNLQVLDDPAFSAEPMLMCGKVTADLRITSLWQGRLEIANLKLQNATDRMPPSLNLVYANGHWNIESLLARAEQVPTAPTGRKRAEQRARFPYIEADAGRINLKIGPEKKPYTLTNTDFAFWLAAENVWHVRLEGRPMRTDMNLNDTGTIRVEGDVRRASNVPQTPVKLQVTWQRAQLGQLTGLLMGQDKGWRGALAMDAEVTGAFNDLRIAAQLSLQDLRRYDIERGGMLLLTTRCLGEYDQFAFDFHCNLPVENGGIRLSGQLSRGAPINYDLALVANRVPLSAVSTFALHANRALPDDLTAEGEFDAAFAFHYHERVPRDWHGTGATSKIVLRSAAVSKPVTLGAIRFHVGSPDNRESVPKGKKPATATTPESREAGLVTIEPFSIDLGGPSLVQAQASLRPLDYQIEVRGAASVDRILDLGRLSGFPAQLANTTGQATVDLKVNGPWANFAAPRLSGTARLQDVASAIPGIKARLLIPSAEAQINDGNVELDDMTAQFEHIPLQFTGKVRTTSSCSALPCPLQFELTSSALDVADVTTVLGLNQKSWSLPFISSSSKMPDFRANGTLTVNSLTLDGFTVETFSSRVELSTQSLAATHISAKLAGGTTQGDWRMDWSGSQPQYSGNGTVTGANLEQVAVPHEFLTLLSSWVTGKANLKYDLTLTGRGETELLAGATGHTDFLVANGVSRALTLEPAKPLKFLTFQGRLEINNQVFKLAPGKLKAANRIYDMDGTISLEDKQAKLKLSSSGAQWQIMGALDKPNVSTQMLPAQARSIRTP